MTEEFTAIGTTCYILGNNPTVGPTPDQVYTSVLNPANGTGSFGLVTVPLSLTITGTVPGSIPVAIAAFGAPTPLPPRSTKGSGLLPLPVVSLIGSALRVAGKSLTGIFTFNNTYTNTVANPTAPATGLNATFQFVLIASDNLGGLFIHTSTHISNAKTGAAEDHTHVFPFSIPYLSTRTYFQFNLQLNNNDGGTTVVTVAPSASQNSQLLILG
jgi:hypothetical protein